MCLAAFVLAGCGGADSETEDADAAESHVMQACGFGYDPYEEHDATLGGPRLANNDILSDATPLETLIDGNDAMFDYRPAELTTPEDIDWYRFTAIDFDSSDLAPLVWFTGGDVTRPHETGSLFDVAVFVERASVDCRRGEAVALDVPAEHAGGAPMHLAGCRMAPQQIDDGAGTVTAWTTQIDLDRWFYDDSTTAYVRVAAKSALNATNRCYGFTTWSHAP
jgi:hypothetical protein